MCIIDRVIKFFSIKSLKVLNQLLNDLTLAMGNFESYWEASAETCAWNDIEENFKLRFNQNDFQDRRFSSINGLSQIISEKVKK